MTITDTIDRAVRDWETSPDAMRWTPEALRLEPLARIAPRLPQINVDLLVRGDPAHFTAALANMAQQLCTASHALRESFAHAATALRQMRCHHEDATRRERISRMHTAYRARRR